jgi:hypothetical protein
MTKAGQGEARYTARGCTDRDGCLNTLFDEAGGKEEA